MHQVLHMIIFFNYLPQNHAVLGFALNAYSSRYYVLLINAKFVQMVNCFLSQELRVINDQ